MTCGSTIHLWRESEPSLEHLLFVDKYASFSKHQVNNRSELGSLARNTMLLKSNSAKLGTRPARWAIRTIPKLCPGALRRETHHRMTSSCVLWNFISSSSVCYAYFNVISYNHTLGMSCRVMHFMYEEHFCSVPGFRVSKTWRGNFQLQKHAPLYRLTPQCLHLIVLPLHVPHDECCGLVPENDPSVASCFERATLFQ